MKHKLLIYFKSCVWLQNDGCASYWVKKQFPQMEKRKSSLLCITWECLMISDVVGPLLYQMYTVGPSTQAFFDLMSHEIGPLLQQLWPMQPAVMLKSSAVQSLRFSLLRYQMKYSIGIGIILTLLVLLNMTKKSLYCTWDHLGYRSDPCNSWCIKASDLFTYSRDVGLGCSWALW